MTGESWAVGRADVADAWARLRDAEVNYSAHEVRSPGWNFDTYRCALPLEEPGPPEPNGVWHTACGLVRDYEFSVPRLVRAFYDRAEGLDGRNMLLEARFLVLRYYCGVRVAGVVDETTADGDRVWGWGYETLEGHLERGRVDYRVVKRERTGEVEFVVSGYSQASPRLGPLTRLGWRLFGRRTQLRFYRGCGRRLRRLVASRVQEIQRLPPPVTVQGLSLAPSDARPCRLERLTVHHIAPG